VTTPFPFIVGCGRSGTTLIRVMLDGHTEMAIPPETMFVAPMAKRRDNYEHGERFDAAGFAADLVARGWLWRWRGAEREIQAAIAEARPSSFPDAVRQVFRFYAERQGKPRYGDKTPAYVLNIPIISEVLPESRFIHLIRDGRDVATSLLTARFGPDSIPSAAMWWERRVRRGRSAGAALGPDRYMEVRYEELVAGPDSVLREICDFIELGYEPEMLTYHLRQGVGQDVGRPEQHRNLRRPPTPGLRDWRRDMAGQDIEVFEALAGGLLSELGYERAFVHPSARARAVARRQRRRARLHGLLARGRSRTGRALRVVRRRRGGAGPDPGAPRQAEAG
jgi:hypothetical protein